MLFSLSLLHFQVCQLYLDRATPTTATLHEVIKKHLDLRFDVEVDDAGVLRDVDVPDDLARQPS